MNYNPLSSSERSVHHAMAERRYRGIDDTAKEEVSQWVRKCLEDGIAEEAILRILRKKGMSIASLDKDDGIDLHFDQLGSREFEDDGSRRHSRSLEKCILQGAHEDVELYLIEARSKPKCLRLGNKCKQTILTLASGVGKIETISALLNSGNCSIDERNRYGQTALHCAKNFAITKLLLDQRADINVKDCYGYTPLHYAVKRNNVEIVRLLSEHASDIVNKVLKGSWTYDRQAEGILSPGKIMPLFQKSIKKHQCRYFLAEYAFEVAEEIYSEVSSGSRNEPVGLPRPNAEVMRYVLNDFFGQELSGFWSYRDSDQIWIKTLPSPDMLSKVLHSCFHFSAMNPRNNMKSSPLHLACIENKGNSHVGVIGFLLGNNGLLCLRDLQGKTADEVLIATSPNRGACPDDSKLKTLAARFWEEKKQLDNLSRCHRFQKLFHRETIQFSDNRKDASLLSSAEKSWKCLEMQSEMQSSQMLRDGTEWLKFFHAESGETFYFCVNEETFTTSVPTNHKMLVNSSCDDTNSNLEVCDDVSGDPYTPEIDECFTQSEALDNTQHSSNGGIQNEMEDSISWPFLRSKYIECCLVDSHIRSQQMYHPCSLACGSFIDDVNRSFHETKQCPNRLVRCHLGCPLLLPERESGFERQNLGIQEKMCSNGINNSIVQND